MVDRWRARLQAQGVSIRQWTAARELVAATLPQPCTCCGDLVHPWQRWHLDHKIPLSLGGASLDLENLGPAHARCNLHKGNGRRAPTRLPRTITVTPSRPW